MSEKFNQKGYSYSEMSNKVEQADRSLIRGRAHEPTGEVESLRGRKDIGRMGDRIAGGDGGGSKHPRPSEILNEKKKSKKQRQDLSGSAVAGTARKRSENVVAASGGQTILDLDDLTSYQPTTQMARTSYESLLVSILFFCRNSSVNTFGAPCRSCFSYCSYNFLDYYWIKDASG
jgi:pre-mRNA-splicing helicase BRR2